MPRTLVVSGTTMQGWAGVEVWQSQDGNFQLIIDWNWSTTPHQHYEVFVHPNGSYWVPVSTNPPPTWEGHTLVEPSGTSVNPGRNERRPNGTYIWIPKTSIPANLAPGQTTDTVACNHPNAYPPA